MIEKNAWVRIHKIILEPSERAPQVPDDTKKVPLELWTKGFLVSDAEIGDEVKITTVTGREETGTLIEVNPAYAHAFGNFIPELLEIDKQVRGILAEGENHEQ
jgi:hypothetical protein